jgi:transposase
MLRIVGVDEFAVRRGHTYGIVLVDMDTRHPVDVLGDRRSTTLAAWLEKPAPQRRRGPGAHPQAQSRRSC